MERKDPLGDYNEVRIAGRRIQCGCPVELWDGTHKHPQCVGIIEKGEAHLFYGSLNPARWTGKRFCRPCALAEGLGTRFGSAHQETMNRLNKLLAAASVNRDLSTAEMQAIRNSVPCPSCGAAVGERCHDRSGSTLAFLHDLRQKP